MVKKISIVIPVYNEEEIISLLCKKIIKEIENLKYEFEIIFVDDGSTDNSWSLVKQMQNRVNNIIGLKLTRNFGHQIALKAGIDKSKGDAVITMDADLQHPPSLIHELILKWEAGFEIVNAVRITTVGVHFLKRYTSDIYYKILNALSDVRVEKGSSDFRLMDKRIVDIIQSTNENQLFIRGFISWLGFKSTSIRYVAEKRYMGDSKFTIKRMFALAINGIMSFSIKPLRISFYLGLTISFLSFLYLLYSLFVHFFNDTTVPGWTSVITSILFFSGVQLFSIGLLGEYIGRIFLEAKRRPLYLVEELNDPRIENYLQ